MRVFQTFDPARSEVLASYSYASSAEIEKSLELLAKRQPQDPISKRISCLMSVAQVLRKRQEQLGTLITREMGKPLKDSRAEIEKSAKAFDYYAENLESFAKTETLGDYSVLKQRLGTLFAIMPWNFPVWQVARVVAPALATGNSVFLKHSEVVAGTAELLTEIFQDILGPEKFQSQHLTHEQAAHVITDPRIRAVTMTGSARGGREVAQTAGRVLKKVVLELGGSDPYLVFEDADLKAAAQWCARTRLINNGQSCVSGKRFLIHESIFEEFVTLFEKELRSYRIGDPLQEGTQLGPLAQPRFHEALQMQVLKLQQGGAELLFRSELPKALGPGCYFAPEAWRVKGSELLVRSEEFFGPVALVMSFHDEEEAIRLANQSDYGLGAGIFTQQTSRLQRVASELECGMVAFNHIVQSDPRVPFGGVKDSGFGRELGRAGFDEFLNFKTVFGHLEI